MSDFFFNAVGFLGPVLFLWAYAMVSLGRWNGQTMATHLLNLLGALAILVSLLRFWNLPVFILETCWSAISIYGIFRAYRSALP